MSDLRTAAQQALEALEHHGGNLPWNAFVEVRKDLRDALAQQAEPLNLRDPAVQKRLAAQWGYVPAAQAEPVEPVAWRTFDGEGGYDYRTYADNENYAAEWAQRNPRHVGWVEPLYTAPPQRKPLTEEEIERIGMKHVTLREVIRAVERAHGIKE